MTSPWCITPIQTLVNAGIREILLVTGGKNAGEFLRLLGNGRGFGLKHLNYTYQEGEGGIAEAEAWIHSRQARQALSVSPTVHA